jgi:hypothetical protein
LAARAGDIRFWQLESVRRCRLTGKVLNSALGDGPEVTMKTDFKFSNLLGTVYCQGNLLFSPDGTHLYSPVGNRVTVFNLVEYA